MANEAGNNTYPPFEFWRLQRVMQVTGRGRSSVYAAVKAGEFPPPIKISAGTSVWDSREVLAHMEERKAESREATPALKEWMPSCSS